MKKVLITYATWSGTTREIAERIFNNFQNKYQVDLKLARQVEAIKDYDSIVLGTSIHAGFTNKDFRKFLKYFMPVLATKPISIFVVCANMIEDNEKNLFDTNEWLNKTLNKFPDLKPISIGFFGGAVLTETVEFQKANFLVKKIIYAMKSKMQEDFGKYDFRDWEKIDRWSNELMEKIGN